MNTDTCQHADAVIRYRLETQQIRRLRRQLRYCSEHVPWYRRYFMQHQLSTADFNTLADLQQLPILKKRDILTAVDQFISDHHDRRRCHSSLSSGSTGEPFRTYFDQASWLRKKFFSKLKARAACGLKPLQRVAIMVCDEPDKVAASNQQLRWLQPWLHARYFSTFEAIATQRQNLQRFQPHNIYGYPSHFLQLAEQDNRLEILQRLFTSSEYLSAGSRHHIEQTLAAPIYDVYGSTEFKEVAWQCRQRNGYHVNSDDVIVEIVNQQADGVGDIVVTDLRNRAMPLIRFHTGDQAQALPAGCRCGRHTPMIRPVSGRCSDYVYLPDGDTVSGFRITTSIEGFPGLINYRIEQFTPTALHVATVWATAVDQQTLQQLQAAIARATRQLLQIDLQVQDTIAITATGKHKVIINHLKDARR